MATWRRKALEYLPELRSEIDDPDVYIYLFFGMLTGHAWSAHDTGDDDLLSRIYGYAEWALNHRSQGLWNPAGVSFYESLFRNRKDRADWEKALHYLPRETIRNVWGLWDYFLTAEETADILKILKKIGKPFTPLEHERPGNPEQLKRDAERQSRPKSRWQT